MTIAERDAAQIPLHSAVRGHDRWIVLGYAAVAAIGLVVILLASAGPGTSVADLAIAAALP